MCIVHFSRELEAEFKAHFSLEIDRFTLPACIENATVRRTLCAASAAVITAGAAVGTSLLPSNTPRQTDLPYDCLLLVKQSDPKSKK